jgi:hypothetical protein
MLTPDGLLCLSVNKTKPSAFATLPFILLMLYIEQEKFLMTVAMANSSTQGAMGSATKDVGQTGRISRQRSRLRAGIS